MASLTVGGVNIKVAVSSPRWTRMDAVDRARAFDNTFRASQTGGAVRVWDFETPPVLAATEGETYKAALSTVASQLCSGDIIALPTMCSAELTDGVPTSVAGDPYVVLSFTLHEQQPAKVLLRYSPGDTITGESFTRSTTGTFKTVTGAVASAAINVKRDAHYSTISGLRSTLLEGARTNLLLRSEQFENAAWSPTNITVTADNTAAPDGTTTADKVAATASAATFFNQSAVVAGTTASYSIHVKGGSGNTDGNAFRLRNSTTATDLLAVTVNYATGAIAYTVGSTGASIEQLTNSWWRLTLAAPSGITSGDLITCYPGFIGGTETAGEYFYAWGAQLEIGAFSSSYIPTVASAVARGTDIASLPYTTPPQELTVYAKFVERGTISTSGAQVFGISSAADANPRLLSYAPPYRAFHGNTAAVESALAASPVLEDTVELCIRLFGDGSVDITQSINSGAQTSGTQTAANGLAAAWSGLLLWLNSGGTAGGYGFIGLQGFKIVSGSRSLSEMRAL